MENLDAEKAKALIIVEFIEYIANSVTVKFLLKKITGNIRIISFDTGKVLNEKVIPFDNFIQIIDGRAEIVIDGISNYLETGQSIIVPAHSIKIVKAIERFKMISTIIKSGYE